jgi:hypothetical protein
LYQVNIKDVTSTPAEEDVMLVAFILNQLILLSLVPLVWNAVFPYFYPFFFIWNGTQEDDE